MLIYLPPAGGVRDGHWAGGGGVIEGQPVVTDGYDGPERRGGIYGCKCEVAEASQVRKKRQYIYR